MFGAVLGAPEITVDGFLGVAPLLGGLRTTRDRHARRVGLEGLLRLRLLLR